MPVLPKAVPLDLLAGDFGPAGDFRDSAVYASSCFTCGHRVGDHCYDLLVCAVGGKEMSDGFIPGSMCKGGTNPPNMSDERPAAPGGVRWQWIGGGSGLEEAAKHSPLPVGIVTGKQE